MRFLADLEEVFGYDGNEDDEEGEGEGVKVPGRDKLAMKNHRDGSGDAKRIPPDSNHFEKGPDGKEVEFVGGKQKKQE